MNKLIRFLKNTSLDIVFGAIIMLHFFSKILDTKFPLYSYILLGISIWVIYSTDHIKDSFLKTRLIKERYIFHQKNRSFIFFGIIFSLITAYFIVKNNLPTKIFIGGSALFFISILYLIFSSLLGKIGIKEFFIALIYTTGILFIPYIYVKSFSWLFFIELFFIAYSNLLITSYFERDIDTKEQIASIATNISIYNLQKLTLVVLVLNMTISLTFFQKFIVFNIFSLASSISYTLLILNQKFAKKRFKFITDGVFYLPIIYFIYDL